MAETQVQLAGILRRVVGIGGESTGFGVVIDRIDVDLSGVKQVPEAGTFLGVDGDIETRSFPTRGRVRTLVARSILRRGAKIPEQLQGAAFLTGTLQTGIVRPGGETAGAELSGILLEVDLGAASAGIDALVDQSVVFTGSFQRREFVERGAIWLLRVDSIAPASKPKPSRPPLESKTTIALVPPSFPGGEMATGISDTLSFSEALLDAVGKLPPQDGADILTRVRVLDISAEFGGIVGLQRLHITIRSVADFDSPSTGPDFSPEDGRLFDAAEPVVYTAVHAGAGQVALTARGTARTSGVSIFFHPVQATPLSTPTAYELRQHPTGDASADVLTPVRASTLISGLIGPRVLVIDAQGAHLVPVTGRDDPPTAGLTPAA